MNRITITAAFAAAALTACAEQPHGISTPDEAVWYGAGANLSTWSSATALAGINTATATEGCPFITRSGDALYFASNRPGGYGALDLYVSHWDAETSSWGPARNLGPEINTASNEQCPLILHSGKELVFVSNRDGGAGGLDLWIARRHDPRDDLGWVSPENMGIVNSNADDFGPGGYEEEDGTVVVYFNSNRTGGAGAHDLYASSRAPGGTFSAATAVAELNSAAEDQFASLAKDGREVFFSSSRPGGHGGLDLWHSTRASTSEPWGAPANLGPAVNTSAAEGRSAISWDGMTLFFHSNRDGSVDLFQTTRTRMTGRRN
jgi:hypothetical protein